MLENGPYYAKPQPGCFFSTILRGGAVETTFVYTYAAAQTLVDYDALRLIALETNGFCGPWTRMPQPSPLAGTIANGRWLSLTLNAPGSQFTMGLYSIRATSLGCRILLASMGPEKRPVGFSFAPGEDGRLGIVHPAGVTVEVPPECGTLRLLQTYTTAEIFSFSSIQDVARTVSRRPL